MTSQPVSSILIILLCLPLPSGSWWLHACPFPPLLLPACLLPPFTVRCKMILARPDEQGTCPYHCSLHLFKMVKRSLCGQIAHWILAQTFLLVTWSLFEIHSILQKHLISIACILLWSYAVLVLDSQAYRKMDVPRECTTPFFKLCN